jgi:hypothetical protein
VDGLFDLVHDLLATPLAEVGHAFHDSSHL